MAFYGLGSPKAWPKEIQDSETSQSGKNNTPTWSCKLVLQNLSLKYRFSFLKSEGPNRAEIKGESRQRLELVMDCATLKTWNTFQALRCPQLQAFCVESFSEVGHAAHEKVFMSEEFSLQADTPSSSHKLCMCFQC